jgi:hypothetical protein
MGASRGSLHGGLWSLVKDIYNCIYNISICHPKKGFYNTSYVLPRRLVALDITKNRPHTTSLRK